MARRTYAPEVKAQAAAALMTGQSVSKVAEEYDIPVGTVKGWRAALAKQEQPVPTQNQTEIGHLLLAYVRRNLEALEKQSEFFGDREWLKDQDASSLAVLHGVLTDKTVRILEAMSGGARRNQGGGHGGPREIEA